MSPRPAIPIEPRRSRVRVALRPRSGLRRSKSAKSELLEPLSSREGLDVGFRTSTACRHRLALAHLHGDAPRHSSAVHSQGGMNVSVITSSQGPSGSVLLIVASPIQPPRFLSSNRVLAVEQPRQYIRPHRFTKSTTTTRTTSATFRRRSSRRIRRSRLGASSVTRPAWHQLRSEGRAETHECEPRLHADERSDTNGTHGPQQSSVRFVRARRALVGMDRRRRIDSPWKAFGSPRSSIGSPESSMSGADPSDRRHLPESARGARPLAAPRALLGLAANGARGVIRSPRRALDHVGVEQLVVVQRCRVSGGRYPASVERFAELVERYPASAGR